MDLHPRTDAHSRWYLHRFAVWRCARLGPSPAAHARSARVARYLDRTLFVALTPISNVAGALGAPHEPERKCPMKLRQSLCVVPKAVRIAAGSILAGSVLLALLSTAGFLFGPAGNNGHRGTGAVLGLMVILFAFVLSTWLLGLGYVYADARRRAMQPVLWVLILILCPHLLGFLLYFVLRQPIAAICANCGVKNSVNQRFCAWCGSQQSPATTAGGPAKSGISGPDSIIAV